MNNTILITDPMHIGVLVIKDKPEYHMTIRERLKMEIPEPPKEDKP